MKIQVTDKFRTDPASLIIPLKQGTGMKNAFQRIARTYGADAGFINQNFKAESEEVLPVPASMGKSIILLGLGNKFAFKDIKNAFRWLSHERKDQISRQSGIDFLTGNLSQKINDLEQAIEAAVTGMILGSYDLGIYKTACEINHPINSGKANLEILVKKSAVSRCLQSAQKGIFSSETQANIFDLVNAPGNKLTPEAFGVQAIESGKENGFAVKVLHKAQIIKEGLDALLAVNRGSEFPPVFIIMEYKPEGKTGQKLKKIGLVGKGVTFDTGGLSIKGSNNMHYMKSDMGGAAAVLGAMELTAKMKLPVHLIGIIPATDNCVDAKAIKPGDVINSYSGKTIEIIDTDAEGRLILADGLAYMNKNYKPDIMLDLATLTGSCVMTLGYEAGGLFTNNNDLARQLTKAGEKTGENLWQLPLWDAYSGDIESDIADVKNFSGRPIAGAIGAAKFLEAFTSKHKAWAHLDIAGVAFGDSPFSKQKSATGFGANLLVEFLSKY